MHRGNFGEICLLGFFSQWTRTFIFLHEITPRTWLLLFKNHNPGAFGFHLWFYISGHSPENLLMLWEIWGLDFFLANKEYIQKSYEQIQCIRNSMSAPNKVFLMGFKAQSFIPWLATGRKVPRYWAAGTGYLRQQQTLQLLIEPSVQEWKYHARKLCCLQCT